MHHQIINVINNVWKLKTNVGDKNEKFVSSLQKVNFSEIYFCRKLRTVNFTAVVHIWKKCILNNPVRIKPGVFWWICKISDHNPADIYSFKVNNRNTKKKVWNMFKVNNKNIRMTSLMSLTSFWCFYC